MSRVVNQRQSEEVQSSVIKTTDSAPQLNSIPLWESGLVVWQRLHSGPYFLIGRAKQPDRVKINSWKIE